MAGPGNYCVGASFVIVNGIKDKVKQILKTMSPVV